jgi:peptide/nickel transport system ATP-binding protein
MIAMAIAAGPSLLIADEPTTALDVTVQKRIIALLKELQAELNLSVIFISHDLRLIGEIADDIIVMKDGKIVEQNKADELFRNPVEPYTRGLLACQPPLKGKPERLLTVEDFESGKVEVTEAEKREVSDEILLSVRNLDVHYKVSTSIFSSGKEIIKAVDKVNLEIRKGETLGLAGESGCGKTTLGKTILKLIEARSGDILYRGKNIAILKRKELKDFRKNVQVVFQDPYSSLNPALSTGSMLREIIHVHFPSLNSDEVKEKAEYYITKVGLDKKDLMKYPHEFSGGQRQRIGIARALSVEPEFLILDESVSALDVSVQAQILNLLNDLKRDFGLSYLFISHDLAVIKYMSDRIIIMRDGRIEEEGIPDDLYNNPISAYTRELISSVPGYQNSSVS